MKINNNVTYKCPTCGAIIAADENRNPVLEKCIEPKEEDKICETDKRKFIMQPLKRVVNPNYDLKYTVVLAEQVNFPSNKVYLIYRDIPNSRFSNFKIVQRINEYIFPPDYNLVEIFFKTTDVYKRNPFKIQSAI